VLGDHPGSGCECIASVSSRFERGLDRRTQRTGQHNCGGGRRESTVERRAVMPRPCGGVLARMSYVSSRGDLLASARREQGRGEDPGRCSEFLHPLAELIGVGRRRTRDAR